MMNSWKRANIKVWQISFNNDLFSFVVIRQWKYLLTRRGRNLSFSLLFLLMTLHAGKLSLEDEYEGLIKEKKLTRIHYIGHTSLVAWSDLCHTLDLTLQLCQVGFIRSRFTYVERSIRRTKSSLYIFFIYPEDIKIFTHFKLNIYICNLNGLR